MLVARGRGEDGTEFSPFASVLGAAEAERCQAGHVALPAPSIPILGCRASEMRPTMRVNACGC